MFVSIFYFKQLSCCGVDSYNDWFETPYGSIFQVPESCCKKSLNHTCARKDFKKGYLPADINADVKDFDFNFKI
jgi:hypothetical protein